LLNYEIHMDPEGARDLESEIRKESLRKNPFPGLRPFTIDESHLYFGREYQVDEVLMKLVENQFVTVLGFSGSGKSSLMYCGVFPVLLGGFMTETGGSWNIVTTRPGISPIDNLAEAILANDPEYKAATEEEQLINKTITASILRSGPTGLIDIAKRYKLSTGKNLLIHLDQFEELFRYRSDGNIDESHDEAGLFVNFIIEAARQKDTPIYIAVTMRSDYIGECSHFAGLTELINESNYLIPQMSRDQLRMVIEGPVAVGGGRISERLVKRLLSDIGDGQDQLPVLQHALMRTWDYWVENRETTEPLDIRHYNAVGRVDGALSQHANEVFDELDDKQKHIAEIIFKALTEKTGEDSGARRPSTIKLIAEIAEVSAEEVITVVEKFREPGRSFLMPSSAVELDADSVIEISHESLMRIWTKLAQWVEEEAESAAMYGRLSEAASMYQIGRTGLWRPPDLQLALNWQKKQRPTRAWAQRYDEAFERAIVFLDTSRITYEAEQRNQEVIQKRLIKRTRMVAAILGIAAVIAIGFFLYAITQAIEAEQQRQLAEERGLNAIDQTFSANYQYIKASYNAQLASANEEKAVAALQEAEIQRQIAVLERDRADYERVLAERARQRAERNERIAEQQRDRAVAAEQEAYKQFQEAQRLLYLSVAQSMSVKSINAAKQDTDLGGLLAQQAFFFNDRYFGSEYDNYIYEGLYAALAEIKGENYYEYEASSNAAIRAVDWSPDGKYIYSAGSDGKVLKWDADGMRSEPTLLFKNEFSNRVIRVSPDNNWLVVGSDSSFVQLHNLSSQTPDPIQIEGHTNLILDIEFVEGENFFYSLDNDGNVRSYDWRTNSGVWNKKLAKSLAVSSDHKHLAVGTKDGKVYSFDLNSKEETLVYDHGSFNPIHTMTYSPDGTMLTFGDEEGNVFLVDINTKETVHQLVGHQSRVNSVAFSDNNKMLAAASYDGTVQMWQVSNPDELPIVMEDDANKESNNRGYYVWDVDFSPDSEYLITGTNLGTLKLWPTNPRTLSNELCAQLTRNMNSKEWERYVGNNIKYEETCFDVGQAQ